MRTCCFYVKFIAGGGEKVMAFNKTEAIILAQAKRIKQGLEYKHIKSIEILQ